jgi:alkanesulfonate monooxygenase SsuD/methylene tetrahydromethanopterin reductase-like flavin-dependent oxidoreductase (luciferase family)
LLVSDLEFGVFDHIDRSNVPPVQLFRDRLRLVDAYEQAGFYSYHVAEHHSTPLGLAPSPGIYLAAVAERTQRMRFGPMVYLLPLYHPLRLAEEVTMLDQMSNGRLDVGVGTGVSPVELGTFGIAKDDTPEMFDETLAVMKLAWTQERITHHGKRWNFDEVPVVSHPVQKPYPPLYYGVGHATSAAPRLAQGFNGITMMSRESIRGLWRTPEAVKAAAGRPARMGVARMVVIDRDSKKAWDIARRAYRMWEPNFHSLWKVKGVSPVFGWRPETYDGMADLGVGIAGSPAEVAEQFQAHVDETGSNYVVGQFVFGDMSLAEGLASLELFVTEVMPKLRLPAVAAG